MTDPMKILLVDDEVGILDTLGVRWLQGRAVKPRIKSSTIAAGGKE